VRFQPVRNTLAALDAEGTLNFVIANDTVRYWSDVAKSLNLAVDASRAAGARRIDFWTTGDVDRRTVAQAAALGARVYQNILAYPLFSAPREDAPERR
jgi:hypothetical protein